jgi:fatty acid desaturase
MKHIAIFLAFLSPFFAVLKFVGGVNISWVIILAPVSIIFAFVLLVWVVAHIRALKYAYAGHTFTDEASYNKAIDDVMKIIQGAK